MVPSKTAAAKSPSAAKSIAHSNPNLTRIFTRIMNNGKGVLFALMTAAVSGVAVFVNSYAVQGSDVFSFITIRNSAVALLLVGALLLTGQLEKLGRLSKRNWIQLAFVGLIGGALPFLLFFQGLSIVDGGARASFLYRALFIIAAMLASLWLRERLSKRILLGVGIAMLGNAMLLGEGWSNGWGAGEILVLSATVLWASEYVISKKVMNEEMLPPRILALGRMGFGAMMLLAFTAFTGQLWSVGAYSALEFQWVLISAAFLFSFVSFWYIGLANTSVVNATSALVLGGPITALLTLAFAGKVLEPIAAMGLFLMAVGAAVVIGYSNIYGCWSVIRENLSGGGLWKV